MTQPYAAIHHFANNNQTGMVDDDGDSLMGWYYQLMASAETALTDLIGPYGDQEECEQAAVGEWGTI